jgi:hypothetical protein
MEMEMEASDALSFPLYQSLVVGKDDENYRQNLSDWIEVLEECREGLQWAASQGTGHYEERHKARGLLLGRPYREC